MQPHAASNDDVANTVQIQTYPLSYVRVVYCKRYPISYHFNIEYLHDDDDDGYGKDAILLIRAVGTALAVADGGRFGSCVCEAAAAATTVK